MHILKIREGGEGPHPTPTLDPYMQYWVRKGIYTCTNIGKYMCVVGEMVGVRKGGGGSISKLKIEDENGWKAG